MKKYKELLDQYSKEKHVLMAAGGSLKLSQDLWSDRVQARLIEECKAKNVFGVTKDTCLSQGSAVNTFALMCYIRFDLTRRGVSQCYLVAIKTYMERYLLAWSHIMSGSGISVHPVPVEVSDSARDALYMEHDAYAFEELLQDLNRAGMKKK